MKGLPEPVVTYQRGGDEFTCDGVSCNISIEDNEFVDNEFVKTTVLTFDGPMRSDEGIHNVYVCVHNVIVLLHV